MAPVKVRLLSSAPIEAKCVFKSAFEFSRLCPRGSDRKKDDHIFHDPLTGPQMERSSDQKRIQGVEAEPRERVGMEAEQGGREIR